MIALAVLGTVVGVLAGGALADQLWRRAIAGLARDLQDGTRDECPLCRAQLGPDHDDGGHA